MPDEKTNTQTIYCSLDKDTVADHSQRLYRIESKLDANIENQKIIISDRKDDAEEMKKVDKRLSLVEQALQSYIDERKEVRSERIQAKIAYIGIVIVILWEVIKMAVINKPPAGP